MQFPDLTEASNVNASVGYWECRRESLKNL